MLWRETWKPHIVPKRRQSGTVCCLRITSLLIHTIGELFETLKTKVDREHFENVLDALAAQLNISRSQLKTMALAEFVEKYENKTALERLKRDL